MTDLEKLRGLLAGAAHAPDADTALAYLGAARAVGRGIQEELKSAMISLRALEDRWRGKRGETAPLPEVGS